MYIALLNTILLCIQELYGKRLLIGKRCFGAGVKPYKRIVLHFILNRYFLDWKLGMIGSLFNHVILAE